MSNHESEPLREDCKGRMERLYEQERSLIELLQWFTVPLLFGTSGPPQGVGSAVLLELGGRHFLLSAGHCIESYYQTGGMRAVICDYPHSFTPSVVNCNRRLRDDDIYDYGYFEIGNGGVVSAAQKIFVTANRLAVMHSSELFRLPGAAVLAGYSREFATENETDYGARLLAPILPLPACGFVPKGNCPNPCLGVNALLLTLSRRVCTIEEGEVIHDALPRLAGSSGCGFWITSDPDAHDLGLRLAGIHMGQPAPYQIDDCRVIGEVLVGHHLRLIADDNPNLQDEIYSQWTILSRDEWAY